MQENIVAEDHEDKAITCSRAIEFLHICWTPNKLMDFMSAKAYQKV